jgi:hypothetical protein
MGRTGAPTSEQIPNLGKLTMWIANAEIDREFLERSIKEMDEALKKRRKSVEKSVARTGQSSRTCLDRGRLLLPYDSDSGSGSDLEDPSLRKIHYRICLQSLAATIEMQPQPVQPGKGQSPTTMPLQVR